MGTQLFDSWTTRYDKWFDTPIGRLIKRYEASMLKEMLQPSAGDGILDVGCGTGIFTLEMMGFGPTVTGVDISSAMLAEALRKGTGYPFTAVCGDMCHLPFPDQSFDKVFSMTALEFVADAASAVAELERVTRKGGTIVLTTLNSLSPWAGRRIKAAGNGHKLFQDIFFRSPEQIRSLIQADAQIKTAIHFQKEDPPGLAREKENQGQREGAFTGAFLAARWRKE